MTMDQHIFEWFNDLFPDEMRACIFAYRDTDGSPKGQDAKRLDGEAATAGAGTASPRMEGHNG